MTRTLSVAAIQTSYGEDLQENIDKTIGFIREAAGRGAQVILPSELFQGPYFCVSQEEHWFGTAYPWRPSWVWRSPCRSLSARGRTISTAW